MRSNFQFSIFNFHVFPMAKCQKGKQNVAIFRLTFFLRGPRALPMGFANFREISGISPKVMKDYNLKKNWNSEMVTCLYKLNRFHLLWYTEGMYVWSAPKTVISISLHRHCIGRAEPTWRALYLVSSSIRPPCLRSGNPPYMDIQNLLLQYTWRTNSFPHATTLCRHHKTSW